MGDLYDAKLSIGEARNPSYGFPSTTGSTDTREARNTKYVADVGEIDSGGMNDAGGTGWWWLRSPGFVSYDASYVYDYGGGNFIRGTLGMKQVCIWAMIPAYVS